MVAARADPRAPRAAGLPDRCLLLALRRLAPRPLPGRPSLLASVSAPSVRVLGGGLCGGLHKRLICEKKFSTSRASRFICLRGLYSLITRRVVREAELRSARRGRAGRTTTAGASSSRTSSRATTSQDSASYRWSARLKPFRTALNCSKPVRIHPPAKD